MHHAAVEVLLLLLVGCVVGVTARRFRLPYTLALVVAGIALGFVEPEEISAFELNADLLFTFLLPALLFEAALHLDVRDFVRNAFAIVSLAVPGVLLAMGITSVVLWAMLVPSGLRPGLGWAEALLFGSVIAATDPISVLALFRELGVERRLYLLVEGESLLNDGVAVVVFLIVAAAFGLDVGHGGHHPHLEGGKDVLVYGISTFSWMAGGGILVGGLTGGLATAFIRYFDDHLVEITVTTVVAYGSFLLAEQFGCSGVLSTVTAGVVTGSFGTLYGMSTRTRLAVEDFWEYAAFVANTLVFLLVGVELQIAPLLSDIVPIALAFVATLLGRAVAVSLAVPATQLTHRPVSSPWGLVMWWGGLRGSLSMVLVLGLPVDFAGRELLIHLVFGVVSASLFLQGLTVAPLLSRLGMSESRGERVRAMEAQRVRLIAAGRALHHLEVLREEGLVSSSTFSRLRDWYEARRTQATETLGTVVEAEEELAAQQLSEALLRLLDVEREAIRHAERADVVGEHAVVDVLLELDERLARLKGAAHHGSMIEAVDTILADTPEAPAPDDA